MGIIFIFIFAVFFSVILFFIKDKHLFVAYYSLVIAVLMFVWGNHFYYEYTHPTNDPNFGETLGLFFLQLISICLVSGLIIKIYIEALRNTMSNEVLKWSVKDVM